MPDMNIQATEITPAPLVIKQGYCGANAKDLYHHLLDDVLPLQPDLVILACGTNDAVNSFNSLSISEFSHYLETMIRTIDTAGAQVMLGTIPDVYQPYMELRHRRDFFAGESARSRIARFNQVIDRLAEQESITVLATHDILGEASDSIHSLFRNQNNSQTPDGVHPTPQGYAKLAAAAQRLIREHFPRARRIVCLGDSITYGAYVDETDSYPAQLQNLLQAQ